VHPPPAMGEPLDWCYNTVIQETDYRLMAKKKKKRKVRVHFRANIEQPARQSSGAWTKKHKEGDLDREDPIAYEAVKGKGPLARRKTVDAQRAVHVSELERLDQHEPAAPETQWQKGQVVSIHGRFVKVDDGRTVRTCVLRQVLKSMDLDQRSAIAVGDQVDFAPIGDQEGVIEQVGPRHGVLVRRYRNKEHLIVSNVDQVVIVGSVAQPELRIHLIDRYIVSALTGELEPVVVFNKVDLSHDEPLHQYVDVYQRLGYRTLQTSAVSGEGIDRLKEVLAGKKTVLAGMSGVGKSTLLNAVQPGLRLAARAVNRSTGRGQHTTTTVSLLKLEVGGYVVDTPGIRQFALWRVERAELAGYFEEFAPFVDQCKFPNCCHIHEDRCAVKEAVEQGRIPLWRYQSYLKIYDDEQFNQPWQR